MTKQELQHLIVDYPEHWVEITKEQFDNYLKLFDEIGNEQIRAIYSSMFERDFYYSPTIRDLLDETTYNKWYQCLITDYVGGRAPYETPIRYKLNTNFEHVLRQVFDKSSTVKSEIAE